MDKIEPLYKGMDHTTLQREYSPSICVDDINVYISQYVDLSSNAKIHFKSQMQGDVRYGSGIREKMDIFIPTGTGPHPVHVFIHGGYWQELSKDESCFAAANFLNHDIIFVALDYCLAPEATLPEIIDQVRRGMIWIYEFIDFHGGDPNNITLSGSSAGGHLVTEVLSTDWQAYGLDKCPFKGGTAISGVYDLTPLIYTDINDSLHLTEENVRDVSPFYHLPDDSCEMIFCYGDNETSEFKRQSQAYEKAWRSKNLPCQIFEMTGFNHFDAPLELANPDSRLFKAILQQILC